MRCNILNYKNANYIVIALYAILSIISILVTGIMYKQVFFNPISLISITTIILLLMFRDKIDITSRKMFFNLSILLIIYVIIFIYILPKYTYNSAKEHIYTNLNEEQISIEFLKPKYETMLTNREMSIFIKQGYIFILKIDGKITYYFFNPITGEYNPITSDIDLLDNSK